MGGNSQAAGGAAGRRGADASGGRAAIAATKAAGRWDEAAAVDALMVPEDLAAALKARRAAEAFFLGEAPSYRRNVLRWLHGAKREAMRIARIKQIVEASARAQKIPQM